MALFGKSSTKKDENKKPAEKAATKAVRSAREKVSAKAPRAKKTEMKAPIVAAATKKDVAVKTPAVAVSASTEVKAHSVIIAPHITEKANFVNEKSNVYTFKVINTATKHSVAHAIKTEHKVTPTDVRLINVPGKTIIYRGRNAFKSGYKKAYVSLKKGDKIDFAI